MLLRLWRTRFDLDRLDELNEFARARSTPMFDSFPGCAGHLFSHSDDEYLAISLWIGAYAIAQAEASDRYRENVEALAATGILLGDQEVTVYDVDGLNLGWESRRRDGEEE